MTVTKITERQSIARILGRLLSVLIHKNLITKEDAEYILDPYEPKQMTNGEHIMSMMPNQVFTEHTYPQLGEFNRHIELVIDKEWWDSEYKEENAEKKGNEAENE